MSIVEAGFAASETLETASHLIGTTINADMSLANERSALLRRGTDADAVQVSLLDRATRLRRIGCWLWLGPVLLLAPFVAFVVLFAQDTSNALWMGLMIAFIFLWAASLFVPCVVLQVAASKLKKDLRLRRIATKEYLFFAAFDEAVWTQYVEHEWGWPRAKKFLKQCACAFPLAAATAPLAVYLKSLTEHKDYSPEPLLYAYASAGGAGLVLLGAVLGLATLWRVKVSMRDCAEKRLVLFADAVICGTQYVEFGAASRAVRIDIEVVEAAGGMRILTVERIVAVNGKSKNVTSRFPLPREDSSELAAAVAAMRRLCGHGGH